MVKVGDKVKLKKLVPWESSLSPGDKGRVTGTSTNFPNAFIVDFGGTVGETCVDACDLEVVTASQVTTSVSSPQPTPAPTTKFKVGDKVRYMARCLTHHSVASGLVPGNEYEVTKINGNGKAELIALQGFYPWLVNDGDFDLVTAAPAQTAAPSPNKTFKPGARVEITPGDPLTGVLRGVKAGELGTIVRAYSGAHDAWWVQVDSTATEHLFYELELKAHVPSTQVVTPEVFMGGSPSVKLIEPCEIVTSVANFKEFQYCRTHKTEPKDCPKC